MDYARAGQRCAVERVLALADLPAVSTCVGPNAIAVRSGAGSNDLNAVVSTPGFVPDRAVLEKLRGWWNGVPASWLVEEPDEALTQVLLNAGWLPERTGRWCARPLGQGSHLPNASGSDGVALEPVTADDDLEHWLDVASDCGWIEDPEDRGVRRELLRPAATDPRQAMWLARLDDRPEGMVQRARAGCRSR